MKDEQEPRWLSRWASTRHRRGPGEPECYWIRWDPNAARPILAYSGHPDRPPSVVTPHFSVDACGVVREEGHPAGPSSVPYLEVRGPRVYAAEGHPDPDALPLYLVMPAGKERGGARVARNPFYGGEGEP